MREVTEEKLEKYLSITEKALTVLQVLPPESSQLRKAADDLLMMATSYFKDARYYKEKGDYVTAFACVNYAHGYIDAGVRLGLFLGDDSSIFAFESR
ncbi:MAG: DUF357 domain-containing protein [Theionarchaea archaeon]|nr:MAG: hypothetical protein AYK18_11220 [Theionarchaea archaeon DG-70]MBU7009899.1 DUF357 domain-containing protein [Theionarchaea archaeon]